MITNKTVDDNGREIAAANYAPGTRQYYGTIATVKDDGKYVIRYRDIFDDQGMLIDCSGDAGSRPTECSAPTRPENPSVPEDNNGGNG